MKSNEQLTTWLATSDGPTTWLAMNHQLLRGTGGDVKPQARLPALVTALAVAASTPWVIAGGMAHAERKKNLFKSMAFASR